MTPLEFQNACKGYNDKTQRIYHTSWEQTRWLGAIQANAFGGKKKIQPQELIKFPWEDEAVDRTKEIKLIKERRKWLTGR